MAYVYTAITLMFGPVMYLVRSRYRAIYGLLEVAVAFLIVIITFFPLSGVSLLADGPSAAGSILVQAAGALGGIYVMVRGLDNINEGLPPAHRDTWRRVFRI